MDQFSINCHLKLASDGFGSYSNLQAKNCQLFIVHLLSNINAYYFYIITKLLFQRLLEFTELQLNSGVYIS